MNTSKDREDVSSELTFTLEEWARGNRINTQDLKDKFNGISPRDERVIAFILDRPVISCYMERVEAAWNNRNSTTDDDNPYLKDDSKARELRLQGNEHFNGKRYPEALYCYNQALRYATFERTMSTEGNEFVQIYSARSALLFECEQWIETVADIKMASKYGCPQPELEERRKISEAKLIQGGSSDSPLSGYSGPISGNLRRESQEDSLLGALGGLGISDTKASPSTPSSTASSSSSSSFTTAPSTLMEEPEPILRSINPKMPALSAKVTESSDPKKGRGLKVTEKVQFGEILAKETPYAHTLFIDCFDDYCQGCCRQLDGHTVPCPGCSVVQYCSADCKKLDKVHWKYTCHPQLPHIFDPLIQLMLRIVCKSFMPEIRSPPSAKLKQSSSTSRSTPRSHQPSDESDNPVVGTNYSSFRKLCHPPIASPEYVLPSIYVGLLVRKMFYSLKNNQGVVIPKLAILIPHIFLHYHRLLVNKVFLVDQIEPITLTTAPVAVDERGDKIGLAIYPTLALINHECVPNVFLFFHGPKAIIRASRTIEPGQELSLCYGPSFVSDSYSDRQRKLREWYYFNCECEVCNRKATSNQICYKCPKCSKPLVVNEDETNQCTGCGTSNILQPNVVNLMMETMEEISRGRGHYERGELEQAVSILSKCYNQMDEHLYRSNCNLIRARSYLAECLTAMGHHQMACKLTAVNVNVTGEICGWETVDYVCIMINYLTLMFKDLEDIWEQGDKPAILAKGKQIVCLCDEQIERLKRLTLSVDPHASPTTIFGSEILTLIDIKVKTTTIMNHMETSH